MSEHATLRPSSAVRWLKCHGSVQAEANYPDITTEPAAEGSAKHLVRAECLEKGLDAYDLIGRDYEVGGYEFTCDDEWADRIQPGLDAIRDFGGELHVETRVDLGTWMPEQFGTLDAGIILPDLIVIDDAKYGRGVRVEAVRNPQLSLYALGFWDNIARHKTKTRNVLIRIDQPYLGGMKEWHTTIDELILFGEIVVAAAQQAMRPDAQRVPFLEGCFYCRALGHCPEANEFILNLLDKDASEILTGEQIMPDLDSMPAVQKASILKHAPLIEKWLDNLKEQAIADAQAGQVLPGMKLVSGRAGPRKWSDPEAVEKFMAKRYTRDTTFNHKLKSPTQLEKAIGPRNWPKLVGYITRAEGKVHIVDENDPRPELVTASSAFDALGDEDDLLGDIAPTQSATPTASDIDDLL